MMHLRIIIVITMLMLGLSACIERSSEELAREQLGTFDNTGATKLFEYAFISSGATGNCAAVYVDKWYGTDATFEEVRASYEQQVAKDNWQIWPEDVVEVWRLETDKGVYSLGFWDYSDELDPEQIYYTIPKQVINEMQSYSTVYLVRMGFMRSSAASQCFNR